jgi:hypothetical protein
MSFLLQQAGRTGFGNRHSTPWVAVVSAAHLATHDLAPDVAKHFRRPIEGVVVAGSEVAEKAVPARSGFLLAHSQ